MYREGDFLSKGTSQVSMWLPTRTSVLIATPVKSLAIPVKSVSLFPTWSLHPSSHPPHSLPPSFLWELHQSRLGKMELRQNTLLACVGSGFHSLHHMLHLTHARPEMGPPIVFRTLIVYPGCFLAKI